ncbi:MAG: hypothetical protein JOZ51_14320 [Chloroflexi bacterium]|nr:hypothetical protein [Chloroflexota bacterium]
MLRRVSATPPAVVFQPVRRLTITQLLAMTLAMGAVLYVGAYLWLFSGYLADDAYIHARIARNLYAFGVPYYNPGEAVAGSSSVLWTLLLAAVFVVTGPSIAVLPWITAASVLGLCGGLVVLLKPRLGFLAATFTALLIVIVSTLHIAVLGMETPLALLVWILSLIAWRRQQWGRVGFFAALAYGVRPEFAVWIILCGLLAETWPARWQVARGAAGPLLAIACYQWFFFGSLIPQTVRAKSIIYSLTFSEFLGQAGLPWGSAFMLVVLAALLVKYVRSQPRWMIGLVGFPVVVGALYAIQHTFVFSWYTPAIWLPLMVACALLVQRRTAYLLLVLALALFVPLTSSFWEAFGVLRGDQYAFREALASRRVEQYLTIGAGLAQQYPEATVMTAEIGGLGWVFPGRIIDAVGLVTPDALRYHPLSVPEQRSSHLIGAIPPQAVPEFKPELVVSMSLFSEAWRAAGTPGYHLLHEYPVVPPVEGQPSTVWGSDVTHVWLRR